MAFRPLQVGAPTGPHIVDWRETTWESTREMDELLELLATNRCNSIHFRSYSRGTDENSDDLTNTLENSKVLDLWISVPWSQPAEVRGNTVSAIAKGMTKNKFLERLVMDRFVVKARSARKIATALRANSILLELSLRRSRIGVSGVIAICNALEENSTLTMLDLSQGEFGTDGAIAIADMLRVNRSLQYLNLSHNEEIAEDGAHAMVKAIEANPVIITLMMFGCDLGDAVLEEIFQATKNNRDKLEHVYLAAFNSNETVPWNRSKLMVVGSARAGKTALCTSFLGGRFNPEWESTIGVQLTEVEANTSSNRWIRGERSGFAQKLAGSVIAAERNNAPTHKHSGIPVHVDTASVFSFESTDTSTVATSVDLPQRRLTDAELKEPLAQFKEFKTMQELQYGNYIRMSVWDYGGQFVFNTLHHIFLTQAGVYLLVFDMTSLLDSTRTETTLKSLRFWLQSLELHAPGAPLLLVGTLLDVVLPSLDADSAGTLKVFEDVLLPIFKETKQLVKNSSDGLLFWPVSNKEQLGIDVLRLQVQEVTALQDYVNTEVSMRWMQTLDSIMDRSGSWLKLKEVQTGSPPMPAAEVQDMLKLFHQLGIVLYFTSTETLSGLVIVNPQWLIDQVCKVIRDHDVHSFDADAVAKAGLSSDLETFLQEGLATQDMLHFLWEHDQVEYLLDLMRQLLLLSDWTFGEEKMYLIPSMAVGAVPNDKLNVGAKAKMQFEILPDGVFERLVCLLVDYSSQHPSAEKPIVKSKQAVIVFHNQNMALEVDDSKRTLMFSFHGTSPAGQALNIVETMVRKIKTDVMGTRLVWETVVETKSGFVPVAEAKRKKIEGWFKPVAGSKPVTPLNIGPFLDGF